MKDTATAAQRPVIDQVLKQFEAGDPAILGLIAPDIDFRIDHYKDDADISWQAATGIEDFAKVLARLGQEIFPQGTLILESTSQDLGGGWFLTRFRQRFYYALAGAMVESGTLITTHQEDGKIDFFREVVTSVTEI
ncbi:hypothetical protein K3725_12630 [Leisingera sp. S132]|uniref:hypothetical protein n=1 Tax=Leisingera sp. S132 TaxID=2867016 RepID=UPI0021A85C5F|nr:hypothetical protein [Leisingera sp. S132]UWQ78161.1 hypothetical protein K3725_12630 [Leisingera sp. S132]